MTDAPPPEEDDPFPHLGNLTLNQLLQRRVEITGELKSLEQERQAIDDELLEVFSERELRREMRAPRAPAVRKVVARAFDHAGA